MKPTYLLFMLILIPLMTVAQYNSRLGRFRVDEKKGCAPLTVTILDANLITVGQCTGLFPCDMTWGDGSTGQNDFTNQYTQPGTYLLQVLYQGGVVDDIQITVTPNIQPVFDVYTCGNREVQVKVTDTNYDSYIINYGDGSADVTVPKGSLAVDNYTYGATGPQTISVRGKNVNADDNCTPPASAVVDVVGSLSPPTIDLLTVSSSSLVDLEFNNTDFSNNVLYRLEYAQNTSAPASFLSTSTSFFNTSSGSFSGLQNNINYYCFRLKAFDPCNNTATLPSNVVCGAVLDVDPQNNLNKVSWNTSTSGTPDFEVYRDGALLGSTNALTLDDNSVTCNTDYVYQVFTNYSNGSQSISFASPPITAISTDVPTAIEDVTAVVGSGSVELTWLQDPAFTSTGYMVFRKAGSGSFNQIVVTPLLQITDDAYSTKAEYCYRINYTDDCGNTSADGIEACPIRLTGKVNNDNSIELSWNAYTGWTGGVDHYLIDQYDSQGNLIQTINNNTSITFFDNSNDPANQTYTFIVRAIPEDGGLGESISNEFTLTKEPNIFYPKAFTPNGDNLNDTWDVIGQYVDTYEMNIFNRWGELLFSTTNLNEGWDGKYRGTKQPEGTYAFVAKITDFAGRTYDRSGSFVLLNKK